MGPHAAAVRFTNASRLRAVNQNNRNNPSQDSAACIGREVPPKLAEQQG